jgi:hypothetical protein
MRYNAVEILGHCVNRIITNSLEFADTDIFWYNSVVGTTTRCSGTMALPHPQLVVPIPGITFSPEQNMGSIITVEDSLSGDDHAQSL